MTILTRYILRAHIGPFLFALSVLTGVLMVNTVARRLEQLAGKGLPVSTMLEVFVLSLPHILALTLPMAVLVAVLYTFSQLAAENEITALKASGVNLMRLLAPLIVAALGFAAGMIWFNDSVLPDTNHRLKVLLVNIGNKSPTLQLKEQVLNDIRAGDRRSRFFLQAAEIDHATNRLRDVVIYDLSRPGQERTIYADSGLMAFTADRTDLFLTLDDGWIHELDTSTPQRFLRTFFERYEIQIKGVGDRLEHRESEFRSDREMSLAQLDMTVDAARREAEQTREETRELSLATLEEALAGPNDSNRRRLRIERDPNRPPIRRTDDLVRRTAVEMRTRNSRAQLLERRANMHAVEYHKKWAISFACIVFVLIGAPLAVRFPRGGVGMVIAVSLTIFGIYYTGLIGGEQLADKGTVSPVWAMWVSNALFALLALWGISRIGREASHSRGGGWDDLLSTLRGLAARPLRLLGTSRR